MKNLATLKRLNNQVVIAMQAARLAAYENLKELAVELPVRSDEDLQAEDCEDHDETERKGLYVYGPGKYSSLSEYRIDEVKAGEKGILCHYCEWNEHEADGWSDLEEFYDCENILECIQWPDGIEQGEAEEEDIYLFFEEQLYDYELQGRHIAVYKSQEEVQKVFDKAVAEERAYAEENGWEIGTDKGDCFESYPDGSWGTSHSTVEWHKVKVNETALCYL